MLLLPQAEPVQAQALQTFVSGVGDDANPCLRTSPCKTFASAMSRTAINGEINCLDPGGFGAVTITKSLTIDCQEVFGSILHSGTNGITISFDLFNAQDTQKTVRLRNLKLNGVNAGLIGIRIIGGSTIVGGAVFIEDCLIDGNFGGAARGISEERTAGGKLFVSTRPCATWAKPASSLIRSVRRVLRSRGKELMLSSTTCVLKTPISALRSATTSGRRSTARSSQGTRGQALKWRARSRRRKPTSATA
jgi:hypothetical protein